MDGSKLQYLEQGQLGSTDVMVTILHLSLDKVFRNSKQPESRKQPKFISEQKGIAIMPDWACKFQKLGQFSSRSFLSAASSRKGHLRCWCCTASYMWKGYLVFGKLMKRLLKMYAAQLVIQAVSKACDDPLVETAPVYMEIGKVLGSPKFWTTGRQTLYCSLWRTSRIMWYCTSELYTNRILCTFLQTHPLTYIVRGKENEVEEFERKLNVSLVALSNMCSAREFDNIAFHGGYGLFWLVDVSRKCRLR